MGKKNKPIDDDFLDSAISQHLAQKKKSVPKSSTPSETGGSTPSSLEGLNSLIGDPAQSDQFEFPKPKLPAEEPKQNTPNEITAVGDDGSVYFSERLKQLNSIYDRVSGNGSAEKLRDQPVKDQGTIATPTKSNDSIIENLGKAWKSGSYRLGSMAAGLPSATIDLANKMGQDSGVVGGLGVLTDWIKDLKNINLGDGKEADFLSKMISGPFKLQEKLEEATANDMDTEKLGQLVEKTAGLPEEYNPLSPNNIIVQKFEEQANKNSELARKNYSGGIGQAIQDGNYAMAGKLAAVGVTESLPITLGIIAGRGAGLSEFTTLGLGMGVGTVGQTYRQLKDENPEMDPNLLYTNAVLTGASEAGSELLGTNLIYNQARRLFQRGATEEAEQVLRTGLRGYIDAAFKKAFVGVAALDEGSTEAVNTIVKNAVDKWSGVRPDVDYTDGAFDSFVIGVGAGASIAGPMHAASKVASLVNKNKVRSAIEENQAIEPYLNNPNLSEEVQNRLRNQVAANNERINEVMEEDAAQAAAVLNPTESKSVSDINAAIDEKEATIADPNMPEPLKEVAKNSITELESEVDQVLTQAQERKDKLDQLNKDVLSADTPEKLSKLITQAAEVTGSAADPAYTELVDKAEKKLKDIKAEKPVEGEKPVTEVKKDLFAELDAELDAMKQAIPEKEEAETEIPFVLALPEEAAPETDPEEKVESKPKAEKSTPATSAVSKLIGEPDFEVVNKDTVQAVDSFTDKDGNTFTLLLADTPGKKNTQKMGVVRQTDKDGKLVFKKAISNWSLPGMALTEFNKLKEEPTTPVEEKPTASTETIEKVNAPDEAPKRETPKGVTSDKYFARQADNSLIEVKNAEPVDIGIEGDYFVHPALKGGGFVVTEGQTGMRIESAETKEEAIAKATEKIKSFVEKNSEEVFNEMITKNISDKPNPRYASPTNENTSLKVGDEIMFDGKRMTVDSFSDTGVVFKDADTGVNMRSTTFEVANKYLDNGNIKQGWETEKEAAPAPKETVKDKIKSIENEELAAAKKAFLDTFKNVNSGINPETLDKGLKLMAVYAKLGVLKFADIVNDVYADVGSQISEYFDSIKASYGAFATQQATDEQLDQMDSIRDVRKTKVEDFINPNIEQNERGSEPSTVDENAPAVSPGQQTEPVNGNVPGQNIEELPGQENVGSSEVGNEVVEGQRAVSTGDTGGSRGTGIDTGGRNSGIGSNADTGSNVPEDTAKRPVKPRENNNHIIGPNDVIVPQGEVGKFNANVDAIFMLKKIDAEGRQPTAAEKRDLAKYVGWGGLAKYLNVANSENEAAVTAYMKGFAANVVKQGAWTKSKIDFTDRGPIDLNKYKSAAELANDIRTELAKEGYIISPEDIRPAMLKNLLSPQEYQSAQNSTISAHYTDRVVVEKMWDIVERLGFKGGRVLESSAGIGNIFGLMPDTLRDTTSLSGYELDDITGRLLKVLYPQANITVGGFENAKIPLNSVDLAITNVPFGAKAPYDRFYPELSKFSLHNYFIGKNLKMLKPGGIGVMISSTSTLDAGASAKFREWIVSPTGGNSVLVGAIRMPNNAFAANAGTQVTSDMLIFQKRGSNDVNPFAQAFRYSQFLKDGTDGYNEVVPIDVNEYYINNPENMLGEMMTAADAGTGALYGNRSTPTLVATPGTDIVDELNRAIGNLPFNILQYSDNQNLNPDQTSTDPISAVDKKEGSLFVKDGKIFRVENEEASVIRFEGKQQTTAKDYVGVKTDLLDLISKEQTLNAPAEQIEELRKELNAKYDAFVKKHGHINSRSNAFLEDYDIDFPIATAMENVSKGIEVGPSGKERIVQEITKGEILKKRVNFPRIEPTEAANIEDAIDISLNYKNALNVPYISQLLNTPPEEVEKTLLENDLAYENPDTGLLETPDEYLSGYVRDKLKKAQIALENDPKYAKNVEELSKVIPEDIPSSLIQYTLGSAWIPTTVYSEFANQIFDADVNIEYLPSTGKFAAKVTRNGHGAKIQTTYAAGGKTGMDILNATLNNVQIIVMDTITNENGNKTQVKSIEKTAAAQAMQEQIQDEFVQFIRENEAVQAETERIYNDVFNGQVLRDYRIPAFEHYPGASTDITLREHQKRAVSRGLAESTLNAHEVGSGKTYTIITTAMEMRRIGTAKKPMIVVQNSTRGQFVSAFRKLYPSAKILVPTDKELSAEGRRRFFAKIATGDWDAILIPQSQLSMIPDDPTRQKAYIQEQIEEMKSTLGNLDKRANNFEYRQMEKEIKKLTEEYAELDGGEGTTAKKKGGKSVAKTIADRSLSLEANIRQSLDRNTDNIFNFEELGVDALLVDEAHAYKRLGFQTSMKNIKGIDTSKSKRSQSTLLKTRWIQEKTGGKNVLFYTGTPISNTMAEAWTMLKYVRPDILEHMGIEYFDQFAKTFGQVVPSLEQTGGGTFKVQSRFARFQNLPEFITAFRAATDVVLSEDVKEFQQGGLLPKLVNGKITQIVVPQTPELKAQIVQFRKTLEWFDKLTGQAKRENSHIPLVIFNKAKQASIDLRLLDPSNVDSPGSKVNVAVAKALAKYKETTPTKGVQMIFSDMYQSPEPKDRYLDEDGLIVNPAFGKDRFHLFNDIKKKLIAGGVKESEIAILTEPKYDKAERKEKLFELANNGTVRFLLGTTERMGVGVNAQQKLAHLIHLDAPGRPMDFAQRNGRIIRQGNENEEVEISALGTEKTLDSSAFQRLSTKQKFINQVMKGENVDRVTEDPADEAQMTFDEMMAQLSDSPFAMQKLLVDNKLRSEKTKRDNFNGKLISINGKLKWAKQDVNTQKALLENDKQHAKVVEEQFPDGAITKVVASGVVSTEKFSEAIDSYIEKLMAKYNDSPSLYAKGAIELNGVQVALEIKNEERKSDKTHLMYNAPVLHYTIPEIGVVENMHGHSPSIRSNSGHGLLISVRSKLEEALAAPTRTEAYINKLNEDIKELERTINSKFDDTKLKQLEAESEDLAAKMIAESNNRGPEDDGPGGGVSLQSDVDYILDQSNVKPILDSLDKLKVSNSGKFYTSIVPIPPVVWNGAIEAMKAVIKATNSIQKGIRVASKYIANQGGTKAQVNDFMQTMNTTYGPGTALANKLDTLINKINESKGNLQAQAESLKTEKDPKAIKSQLVNIMAEARKSQLVKTGMANADNAAVAIQKVAAINSSESSAQEAVDAVLDFLNNVGYNTAIKFAMNAHNRLDSFSRRNKMSLSPTGKKLAAVNPRTLTEAELNTYLELAPVLVAQLEGRDPGLVADNDIAAFLNDVRMRQDEEIKAKLMKKYTDLGLNENMTVEEMKDLISESKEETEEKEQTLKPEEFKNREGKKREIVLTVLSINRDELHAKKDIPAERKFVTDALMNIDESMLSTADLVRLNQIIANIVANDRYTGAGYFSKINQGIQQLKKYNEFVGKTGGFRPITHDSFLKDRLQGSRLNALSLTDKFLHLNTFEEVGKATDEMISYPIGNGYQNQKSELKSVMDGLDAVIKANGLSKSQEAVYRIGVFGELNAYLVGDTRTKEEQFIDNKMLLAQSIAALAPSKNKYEQQVHKVLTDVWNEIEGATSISDLSTFLSPAEQKVYDFIRESGETNFNRLYENNEMYGGKPMVEKANYVHRRYLPLRDGGFKVDLIGNEPIIASANGVLGESGTKRDVTIKKKLPKGKVIDYNIYKSFRLGLNESLNDIYTLGDRIKADYILNSPMFEDSLSFGNTSGRRNLNIIKDSIQQMVNLQRGIAKIDMDMYGGAAKVMNFFRQTFYTSAVGTVTAALPQYLSSAMFALSKLNHPSSYVQSMYLFATNTDAAKRLIQVAGSGTANRDLQGDSQLDDVANNLSENLLGRYVSPKISESIDWMNDKLFASLKYGDRLTSLHSWMAGYIDNLIDQGVIKSASEFNIDMLNEHLVDPNTMAAVSGETLVTMSNNESDASRKPNMFVNKTITQEWVNDFLFPVKKFAVAMNNKLWLGIRNISEWDGAQGDGARLVVGALTSVATYAAIRDFVINKFLFDLPAGVIMGAMGIGDEDDEEQKRLNMTDEQYEEYKKDKELYKFSSEVVSDAILGGQNVLVEKGAKNLVNALWTSFGDDINKERRAKKLYSPYSAFYANTGVSSMFGVYGKPLGLFLDLNSNEKSPLNVLMDLGKETDAADEAKARRLLFSVGIPLTTQFLFPSADVERINNRIKRRVEKIDEKYRDLNLKNIKNKEYKKHHEGGGGGQAPLNF